MINPRVSLLHKSATLKITALTKQLIGQGKDVVDFAAGEPDFDTPDFICQAGLKAIQEGMTKYTPSAGIGALRDKIAQKLSQENNIAVTAENVIVTSGAKYAIYVALLSLLDEGDEVLLPAPYWVSYPEMIRLSGAKSVIVPTTLEQGFKLTPQSLSQTITKKSKILILNYPSNPTGATYAKEELQALWNVIKDHNIFVLSDEIYEHLLYDGLSHYSFAALEGAFPKTMTVNGFSKTFAMTGWRLGYVAGPREIIQHTLKIIDHTTSCACSVSQYAGLAALNNQDWQKTIRCEFESRRNVLWEGIRQIDQLRALKPQGTFYLFCDISKTGLTAFEFASRLLEEQLVSVIPAESFGAQGFVRLSFATSVDRIKKGIERIQQFVQMLKE